MIFNYTKNYKFSTRLAIEGEIMETVEETKAFEEVHRATGLKDKGIFLLHDVWPDKSNQPSGKSQQSFKIL